MKLLPLATALLLPLAANAQEQVSVALDWTLNTNHVGLIVARDKGFYEEAGLEVDILPYSESSPAVLLAAGATDFAYLTALGFFATRASGAEITALGVVMQHDTGRLVYNSENPEITRPADLSGKIYAGFGSALENALISTMIANDGGEPVYETVVLGTGAYEALASGAVDFTLEVATWEGVNSKLLGRKESYFTYADYGIPDQQTGYIGVGNKTLKERPDLVNAFIRATQRGYAWAADNPEQAAELLIEVGEFPNPELVKGSMQEIVAGNFIKDGDTPVGKIDPERFTATARFYFDSGVLKGLDGTSLEWPGDISDWYDQSWLAQ